MRPFSSWGEILALQMASTFPFKNNCLAFSLLALFKLMSHDIWIWSKIVWSTLFVGIKCQEQNEMVFICMLLPEKVEGLKNKCIGKGYFFSLHIRMSATNIMRICIILNFFFYFFSDTTMHIVLPMPHVSIQPLVTMPVLDFLLNVELCKEFNHIKGKFGAFLLEHGTVPFSNCLGNFSSHFLQIPTRWGLV